MATIDVIRSGRATPVTIEIDDRCVYTKKVMGEHRITCEIIFPGVLDVLIGDWIVFNPGGGNENFTVNQLPGVVKIDSSTYKYSIVFEAELYNLNKKIFKDGEDGLSDFAYNNNPQGFIDKIILNIDLINPSWTGTAASGVTKTLQFTNESCGSALSKVVEMYKMEYDITNKVITLLPSIGADSGYTFEYGKENGLYKLEREQISNQKIVTRCYGFGGTTNIPADYRSGAKRLVFEVGGFRYLYASAQADLYGIIEDVFTDDSIFPQRTSTLTDVSMAFNGGVSSAVARVDKIVKNSTSGDCVVLCNGFEYTMVWSVNAMNTITNFVNLRKYGFGAVDLTIGSLIGASLLFTAQVPGVDFLGATTITAGKGTASTIIPNDAGSPGTEFNIKDSYLEDTAIDFDIEVYRIAGQTPTIVFKDGDMDGVECEISKFDFATKRIYIKAYTHADGYTLPNADLHPHIGDSYTLINIKMPDEYIVTAEAALQAATQAYLDLNCVPHVIYTLDLDPKDAKLNSINLKAGDRVTIVDSALGISNLIRINSIEYPLVNPYKIKAIITDYVLYTLQQRLLKSALSSGKTFSTGSPQSGSVPGGNNAGATYFLNAMGTYSVPIGSDVALIPKIRIHFTDEETPTISDYNTKYAPIYGQNPTVRLFWIDENGDWVQWMQEPKYTIVAGLISSISWDIGYPITGFIILQ